LMLFTKIASNDRNLKRTISRLVDRKFITRMQENFLHSYAVFYQINQSKKNLESLSLLMNRDCNFLKQKYVRMKELLHEQAGLRRKCDAIYLGVPLAQVMSIGGLNQLKTTNTSLRAVGTDLAGATEKLSYSLPQSQLAEVFEFTGLKR
jgi:hypothetical protein